MSLSTHHPLLHEHTPTCSILLFEAYTRTCSSGVSQSKNQRMQGVFFKEPVKDVKRSYPKLSVQTSKAAEHQAARAEALAASFDL